MLVGLRLTMARAPASERRSSGVALACVQPMERLEAVGISTSELHLRGAEPRIRRGGSAATVLGKRLVSRHQPGGPRGAATA